MRTGTDYLHDLDDGRVVFVNGKKVKRVADHPAFAGIAKTVGDLYNLAASHDEGMTHESPEVGCEANRVYAIPRSIEELAARRAAITRWARSTHGFVGRSPDHVAGFLAGFAAAPHVFTRERDFAENVTRFYRRAVEGSLFTSYVIIPPQVDRSTTASGGQDDLIQVGVHSERDGGIVVRGSQMLGTATAVSDYLFVSCIKPLQPEDERHALSFVVPVHAPGLKVYCRRPYALGQPSRFDYPLSTRFDETDALIVFDDVFVPWDDVFVYRDVEAVRNQFFATAAHVLGNTQAQIRLVEKTKFILGVARKIAAVNGIDAMPPVHEKLADLASLAAIVEGMVLAAESTAAIDGDGVARPNGRFLYGAMGLQAELYPRMLHLVRDLAGAGVLQVPSSVHELVHDETRGDMERYLGASGVSAEERVKLFKLAWDTVSSEFAGRHHQYEMFYAGAPFVAKGYAYRNYGFDEAIERVDEFLDAYNAESDDA